jgi:hypothetical protein
MINHEWLFFCHVAPGQPDRRRVYAHVTKFPQRPSSSYFEGGGDSAAAMMIPAGEAGRDSSDNPKWTRKPGGKHSDDQPRSRRVPRTDHDRVASYSESDQSFKFRRGKLKPTPGPQVLTTVTVTAQLAAA